MPWAMHTDALGREHDVRVLNGGEADDGATHEGGCQDEI